MWAGYQVDVAVSPCRQCPTCQQWVPLADYSDHERACLILQGIGVPPEAQATAKPIHSPHIGPDQPTIVEKKT